ncbi:MAG: ABC transporter ATP-binding protein [Deltaproteobacteria bacterium]|nr:ABC transporter ATP-binding protein [Deltaproteobacteria bacterium]
MTAAHPRPALEVKRLRVEFDHLVAVDDVSLTVEPGMIFGLLGPNGAGKTTLMTCVAGLAEATYGEVWIGGRSLEEEREAALARLGFQPDVPPMLEGVTVYELLELFASAYGVPAPLRAARIEELLALVQLSEHRDALSDTLSRGMRQRVFLAKTLLPAPPLLILDEPASGLDPIARRDLAEVIRALGARGVAVVISSHVLEELDGVCDSLGVMFKGRLLDAGRLEDVRRRLYPEATLDVCLLEGAAGGAAGEGAGLAARVRAALGGLVADVVALSEPGALRLTLSPEMRGGAAGAASAAGEAARAAEVVRALVGAGLSPHHVALRRPNLQDIFVELSERAARAPRG